MKDDEEAKLLAELFANLKTGKKTLDWITLAQKVQTLVEREGSSERASAKLPIGAPMIRSIVALLRLPEEVQQMVREKRILQDAAQRLAGIRDREQQLRIAKEIDGLPSHDARQVILYGKRFPTKSLARFGRRVASSKGRRVNIHLMVLPLEEETFRQVRDRAQKQGKSVQRWILERVSAGLSTKARRKQ